eukprot:6185906-Pleurochrysis_carterae.AAC.2
MRASTVSPSQRISYEKSSSGRPKTSTLTHHQVVKSSSNVGSPLQSVFVGGHEEILTTSASAAGATSSSSCAAQDFRMVLTGYCASEANRNMRRCR